jgi:hypothetical protein
MTSRINITQTGERRVQLVLFDSDDEGDERAASSAARSERAAGGGAMGGAAMGGVVMGSPAMAGAAMGSPAMGSPAMGPPADTGNAEMQKLQRFRELVRGISDEGFENTLKFFEICSGIEKNNQHHHIERMIAHRYDVTDNVSIPVQDLHNHSILYLNCDQRLYPEYGGFWIQVPSKLFLA